MLTVATQTGENNDVDNAAYLLYKLDEHLLHASDLPIEYFGSRLKIPNLIDAPSVYIEIWGFGYMILHKELECRYATLEFIGTEEI